MDTGLLIICHSESLHPFLFDLVVDHVSFFQFAGDVLHRDACLHHQHQHMVSQVADLIDGLGLVRRLNMKTKKHNTSWMVSVALMAAIVIVLANTPLGMIQLPIIKATTVHIPVIIGAILLGPAAGAILGGVFGICSLISNTMAPTLLSFAFSPFMSTTGIPGAVKAVWISVGCRILIGVAAGWLWILFSKLKVNSRLLAAS